MNQTRLVANHPLQASGRTHWHSLIDRSHIGAQAMRTHETDARNIVRRGHAADRPTRRAATSRRQTTPPTLNPERGQPYRPRPVPAAAPCIHRSTHQKTGAHVAAWHALAPGATRSLPAPLPHYDEPTLGPFTATTKDVPDAMLPRAALCHVEHARLFRPGASHSARHTLYSKRKTKPQPLPTAQTPAHLK